MEQATGIYGRRSIRLKDYDYTQAGAYFVTIAVQGRLALFGEVVNGVVRLSDAGKMAHEVWQTMPQRIPSVEMDAFIVMPDHVHGTVVIRDSAAPTPARLGVGASLVGAQATGANPAPPKAHALGEMVGAYKSLTTLAYTRGVHTSQWLPFHRRLWQRNFYERVIRNQYEMDHLRAYIRDNPARWPQTDLM